MEETYVCPICGSEDMQIKTWVKINSLKNKSSIKRTHIETEHSDLTEGSIDEYWCPTCQEHIIPIIKE